MKVKFLLHAALTATLFLSPVFNSRCLAQGGNCLDFDGSNDYVTLNALDGDMSGSTPAGSSLQT